MLKYSSEMPGDAENVDLPSIYIAQSDLDSRNAPLPTKKRKHRTYLVNGEIFHEEDSEVFYKESENKLSKVFYGESCKVFYKERVEDSLVQFELYDMDIDEDMYCSTPSGSESESGEDLESELRVTIQPVANGYIVNNSSFLTVQQWNTLVTPAVSHQLLHCVVCAQYIETKLTDDHVTNVNHRLAIQAFPPLKTYDLSITRKIRNQLHCAVCNEVFDLESDNEHFAGKMHEGNLLFSINKASDILDNSLENNNNQTETYHFKTHAMNRTNSFNDTESVDSDNFSCNDNHNFINYQHIDNYFYDDYEEETPVFTGQSYASMARKPKLHTQQYIEIDLGNRKVTVTHDSWHMIIISPKTMNNKFWCMACKKYCHIRKKLEHCSEVDHLNKLDKCKVVPAYEEYFIRQVDDKLYHCGHCNNLQLIHEIENHVESEHPRKTRLVSETKTVNSPVKQNVNTKPTVKTDNPGDSNGAIKTSLLNSPRKSAPINMLKNNKLQINNNNSNNTHKNFSVNNDQNSQANNGIMHKMPGSFDNIVVSPFHSSITLPSLSYNIVCKRPKDYYCGLCDLVFNEDLITKHIYEVVHLERMQRHPFIAPFGNHLIRAIRNALHCAVCNLPLAAASIYEHLKDPKHLDSLEKALNQGKPKLPPIGVKIPNISAQMNPNVANGLNHAVNSGGVNSNGFGAANNGVRVADNGVKFANNGIEVKNKAVELPYNAIRVANNVKPSTESEVHNPLSIPAPTKYTQIHDITEMYKQDKKRTDSYDTDANEEFEEAISDDADEELEETFDSVVSDDATFDAEEHVYLKLRNNYIKISNTSYNTLVHVGDGSRYCFVCAIQVQYSDLQKHVDGRSHMENMEKYRFLDKYEDHLLRQIYLMYHCAICNVIITRKELKTHLEWPTHDLQNINLKNIKKTRKTEIKGGVKQVVVSTQKEIIYLHDNESKIKILYNVQVSNKNTNPKKDVKDDGFSRKNKIIFFHDNVLKISWDSWHGISKIKSGFKCNLCQRDLKGSEIDMHCTSEWHKYALDKTFEKQYAPALIRKINESTLNCLFCNTEVSNKEHLVQEHLNGKKHAKSYEAILKESSNANTYADCHDDVLML